MATLWADKNGNLIKFFMNDMDMNSGTPAGGVTKLDFDHNQNSKLIELIHNHWNEFSIVDNILKQNNNKVNIIGVVDGSWKKIKPERDLQKINNHIDKIITWANKQGAAIDK
jgi:predicted patatin/cPLA2 family phospholipase